MHFTMPRNPYHYNDAAVKLPGHIVAMATFAMLIVVLCYMYFLACWNYLQKTGTPPCRKDGKNTYKGIFIERCIFGQQRTHARWAVSWICRLASTCLPSVWRMKCRILLFEHARRQNYSIITYYIQLFYRKHTSTNTKNTSFTLIQMLESSVT